MIPGRKWYFLAFLLFIAGPLLGLYLLFQSIYAASKNAVTFMIPGTSAIYIIHPGEYTLWMENLQPKNSAQVINNLQQMTLTFVDPITHKAKTLSPKLGWSSKEGSNAHYSLGTLRFEHIGRYQLIAQSPAFTPYKVYLRQPSLSTIIKALALGIFLAILGIVSGILLAIIILIKRMSGRNAMDQSPNENKPNVPLDDQPKLEQKEPEAVSQQATTWAMICHLSGFAGFVFPFANIIAPLLIWGFKRHEYPYLDAQGKEAINFQISITIYYVIAAFLILLVIGLFLLPLIAAFHIIAMIIASVEAAQGRLFRYPLTIRFLK